MLASIGSTELLLGQSPFLATNSQVMEWNDPSFYQISDATSKLGLWYQSQYGQTQVDLFRSYALYGHHTFTINQKDSWGVQLMATHDQDHNQIQTTQVVLGGSYQKLLSAPRSPIKHKAGVGLQSGISRQVIQGDRLWFTNQFDVNSEMIRFEWEHGESIPEDRFASNSYFPIHAGVHYALEHPKWSGRFVATVSNINRPEARFEGITTAMGRGYFLHLEGELKLSEQLGWGPWFSYGKLGVSEVFQLGTRFNLDNTAYQDWKMRLGLFTQLSPRISSYQLTQFGASFDIQWNEVGMKFNYLFPLSRIDNIGNTFQIGLFFVPKIDPSLTY